MLSFYDIVCLWDRFFFADAPVINVAVFRVCLGLLYLFNVMRLYRDRDFYFSDSGIYHSHYWKNSNSSKTLNIFNFIGTSKSYVQLFFILFFIFSLSMTVGFCSRFSMFACYVFWTSLNHRNLYIFHSGDALMRLVGFLLVFSHAGEALSVDNYIQGKSQYMIEASPWVQRLMMIQISMVYVKSVINKLNYGWNFWFSGVAIFYVLRNTAMMRVKVPKFLMGGPIVILAAWLTLFSQVLIGVGLWFRETVCPAFFAGILMHLCFGAILNLGFFSHIMISCLILFVDPYYLQGMFEQVVLTLEKNLY